MLNSNNTSAESDIAVTTLQDSPEPTTSDPFDLINYPTTATWSLYLPQSPNAIFSYEICQYAALGMDNHNRIYPFELIVSILNSLANGNGNANNNNAESKNNEEKTGANDNDTMSHEMIAYDIFRYAAIESAHPCFTSINLHIRYEKFKTRFDYNIDHLDLDNNKHRFIILQVFNAGYDEYLFEKGIVTICHKLRETQMINDNLLVNLLDAPVIDFYNVYTKGYCKAAEQRHQWLRRLIMAGLTGKVDAIVADTPPASKCELL